MSEVVTTQNAWNEMLPEEAAPATSIAQHELWDPARRLNLALVTAGQSPRLQIMRDLIDALPPNVTVTEFGALDDIPEDRFLCLPVDPGHPSMTTQLRSGRSVHISDAIIHEGIQRVLSQLSPAEYDYATVFCTGRFAGLSPFSSECRLIQAQPAMENAVRMLVRAGHRIGLIAPHVKQLNEAELFGLETYQRRITWLDTAVEADWSRVVAASRDCEVLVLASMGYDEDAATRLRRETGLPVILPRRVLTSAIRTVMDVDIAARSTALTDQKAWLAGQLTRRERQIMWLMVEGLPSKGIARQLEISPRTVSVHRAHILAKLHVANTTALIRLVLGAP